MPNIYIRKQNILPILQGPPDSDGLTANQQNMS